MAKRRFKKRPKRSVVRMRRKVKINAGKLDGSEKMRNSDKIEVEQENTEDCPKLEVQFTENKNWDTGIAESDRSELQCNGQSTCNRMPVKVKGNKSKSLKTISKQCIDSDETNDEGWIYPSEINGETFIDIQCGANDALMYLDRLCGGSQGACIKFVDSWLTPNEFQMISGRETAKDWKRSIRHKGRSLKLLINKGLINLQTKPKKSCAKSTRAMSVISDKTGPETKQNYGDSPVKSEGDENLYLLSKTRYTVNGLQTETQRHAANKKRGRKSKTFRGRRLPKRDVDETCANVPDAFDKTRKTPDVNSSLSDEAVREETVRVKTPDSTDNGSGELADHDNPAPTDTLTEEERRLDEFVKSLQLTKNNGQRTSLAKSPTSLSSHVFHTLVVPSLNDVANKVQPGVTTGTAENRNYQRCFEAVDSEMPILQKEDNVINDYEAASLFLSSSLDAVNATVTPPPTPPSDQLELGPMDKSVDSLKHIETFKSTLASPTNGLKLTINREKVNCQKDFTVSNIKVDTTVGAKSENHSLDQIPEASTRTLLLQDALKSARKYKEQLHQSQLKSPTKSTSLVSKATIEPILTNTPTNREQCDKGDTKRTTNGYKYASTDEGHRTGIPSDVTQRQPSGQSTHFNHLTPLEDVQRHASTSIKKFMSVKGSVFGSLPENMDKKDTLRELQLKYDMLRMLQTQGQLCMTSSHSPSLLYPMVTQQLLLAMTQQLQSMYNIPDMPVTESDPSDVSHKHDNKPPMSGTSDIPNSRQNSFSSHFNFDENRPMSASTNDALKLPKAYNNNIGQLHTAHSMHGNHTKKRKHVDVNNDGAIDLSMKKPRTVVNSYKPTSVLNIDGPLDFSLKRSYSSNSSTAPSPSCASYSSQNLYSSSANGTTRHQSAYSNVTTNPTTVMTVFTNYRNQTDPVKPSSGQCTCSSGFSEMTSWNVGQVCSFLTSLQGCAPYIKTFREQGISGRLLPYLTSQHLTQTLGMNSIHASSLMNAVERRSRYLKPFNCSTCRAQKAHVAMPTHS